MLNDEQLVGLDREKIALLTCEARSNYAKIEGDTVALFVENGEILYLSAKESKDYCVVNNETGSITKIFATTTGNIPDIFLVENCGLIICAKTKIDAEQKKQKFLKQYAKSPVDKVDTRVGSDIKGARLHGKLTIITGAAQGFGKGLGLLLASEGATIGVADLNYDGAKKTADEINEKYGAYSAVAIKVDVGDEESVKKMCADFSLEYGGIDIFISNAGVLKAGSLEEIDFKTIDFITRINYIGYFLGVKYASKYMKTYNALLPDSYGDIIQINSKSGLEGSNKNFCYAGSKFGGIGLTQSFALELVGYNIKVNSICPGNFLDGPLWCDPERGLFVQYLKGGKVKGAKTIADVKAFYESKVPMNRGCTELDVARAVYYLVEQKYETGQALPVTGGQVMLN